MNDELQSASAENAAMADTLATLSSAGGADAIMVKVHCVLDLYSIRLDPESGAGS